MSELGHIAIHVATPSGIVRADLLGQRRERNR
jgi:hypothetical protein